MSTRSDTDSQAAETQNGERLSSSALLDLVIFGFLSGMATMAGLVAVVTQDGWGWWLVASSFLAIIAEIQRRVRGVLI